MAFAQPGQPDARPSTAHNLSLSSNNPFRNRAASPNSQGQLSPLEPPPRPLSRNPFLDASADTRPRQTSPDKMSFSQPSKPALSGSAAELFDELTIRDKPLPPAGGSMRGPPRSITGSVPPPYTTRPENVAPGQERRPSRSQEEAMRARRPAGGSSEHKQRPSGDLDIFADPASPDASSSRAPGARRARRNSDSSILSKNGKLLDPEDEKKRLERKRRERRHRERESRDKTKKPDRKLDVIDKLDVTSIYGTGLFHHDGPFDACNPHRNRQGSRRAPMQAFPKDSVNNTIGGGGPLNKRPDHATFLGNNNEEAFKDYSKGSAGYNGYEPYSNGAIQPPRPEVDIQSATTRVEPIHGEETLGLGTSTFLEGAPASRAALQRRETEERPLNEGGLGRKKSLAQKIRGINNGRRDYGPSGRITSPDGVFNATSPEGRTPGGSRIPEANPFFNEFSRGDEKLDTRHEAKPSITIAEPPRPGRSRAVSSPKGSFGELLQRRATSDGSGNEPSMPPSTSTNKTGGGFLARVKSLKGGRKPKQDD